MARSPNAPDTAWLLNAHLTHDVDAGWYCDAGIPPKKLSKAIRAYGGDVRPEYVLALGDGTVFGSAKEGILITSTHLISGTSDGRFSVPLSSIVSANRLGGWPEYSIEVRCDDGSAHKISTTCFDKKQECLTAFFNALRGAEDNGAAVAAANTRPSGNEPSNESPATIRIESFEGETSIRAVNAGMKLVGICPHESFDDAGELFDAALAGETETALLKGYCRYVGFNGREVDGIFLVSNKRLQLFSMESGAKILFVEMAKRLLGAVPVPFLDSVASFLLFSIPRSIYVAIRGGREKLISQALGLSDERLLSAKPPLRRIEETPFVGLSQTVNQVTIGSGVWTGVLSREFGISFAPVALSGAFSVPKDLILPEYETLEPLERLLFSIREPLARRGLGYRLDADGEQLTIFPVAVAERLAA